MSFTEVNVAVPMKLLKIFGEDMKETENIQHPWKYLHTNEQSYHTMHELGNWRIRTTHVKGKKHVMMYVVLTY